MNRRLLKVFAVILILIIASVALVPVYQNHARLGLDLQGGVMVRLEAPKDTSNEDMIGVVEILTKRVNALGVVEPEIRREGERRVVVELPGVEDAEEAVRLIGTTAKLEFMRSDNEKVILSGGQLKKAAPYHDDKAVSIDDQFGVNLQFDSEGAKAFSAATQELVQKYGSQDPRRSIAIVLDGQVISQPYVRQAITGGNASISGHFASLEEAQNLATLLNSGALPVDLEIIEQNTVGPQLGPDAIAKSITAVIIGCALLALFLFVIYRTMGVVAIISLLLYAMLLSGALVLIRSTITLPVIAAFLLSIGMAVDANVLIYERIKEELGVGKTLRVSIESGFKKAFGTILDSNATTLIAGVVLIALGTGPVRGFAITLCIGILLSLFTAIVFTRMILVNLVHGGVLKTKGFFGVKGVGYDE